MLDYQSHSKNRLKVGLFAWESHPRDFGQGKEVGFLDKTTIRVQSNSVVMGHHQAESLQQHLWLLFKEFRVYPSKLFREPEYRAGPET